MGGAFVKSLIDFRDSALYGHIGHLICRKVKSSDTECWVFILSLSSHDHNLAYHLFLLLVVVIFYALKPTISRHLLVPGRSHSSVTCGHSTPSLNGIGVMTWLRFLVP